MQRSRILVVIAVALAPATIAAGACSFPTITIAGPTSGSGGGSTSSETGPTTGTGGANVTSSSGSSSSEASSGTSASSSSSGTSSSSSGAGCTLDDDHDGVLSWLCDPTQDCGDQDKRAQPGSDAGFQAMAMTPPERDNLLFDFDCDGIELAETPTLTCGLICDTTTIGFGSAVPCGTKAALGKCGGFPCGFLAFSPAQTKTQRCK